MTKCPIVKIILPVEYGFYARQFYCDKHSLTVEIFPINEYQIERLEEDALLGLRKKGCIIPDEIKEYQLFDWLKNKDKFLENINSNNLNKGESNNAMQRYMGINPNSQNRNRNRRFTPIESSNPFIMLCYE